MRDPIPGVRPSVEAGALDVDGAVAVAVAAAALRADVPDGRGMARGRPQAHLAEQGGREQVDVLAGDGEEPQEGERGEGAHRAVVVAGDAVGAAVELRRDVLPHPVAAERRASRVVELERR